MPDNAVFSIAYFPPVQYFSMCLQYSNVWIEQHENYCKQSYRNRCEILSANGKVSLVVPIIKNHGMKIPIKEVRIDYDTPWQKIHRRAIESAYGKAPFYIYYADEILAFFDKKYTFLFDMNMAIFEHMLSLTGIEKKINFTDDYHKDLISANDYRAVIHPKTNHSESNINSYYQVFGNKFNFEPRLSILDLLFNEGNRSREVLQFKA